MQDSNYIYRPPKYSKSNIPLAVKVGLIFIKNLIIVELFVFGISEMGGHFTALALIGFLVSLLPTAIQAGRRIDEAKANKKREENRSAEIVNIVQSGKQ